jgi:hypothetical protein
MRVVSAAVGMAVIIALSGCCSAVNLIECGHPYGGVACDASVGMTCLEGLTSNEPLPPSS